MKLKIVVLAILLSGSSWGYSQDVNQSEVPALIVNAFMQKFKNTTDVEWELKNEQYKVEFEMENRDYDAWYDMSGNLSRYDEEIKDDALPAAVMETIKRDFDGFRIDDVEKRTISQEVTYKAELKTLSEEWRVIFKENGEIIEKVAD